MKKAQRLITSVILLASFSVSYLQAESTPEPWKASKTEKYRLVWVNDPTTKAIVGWNQKEGSPGSVHYGEKDHGRDAEAYPMSKNTSEVNQFDNFTNCFVNLDSLKPDSLYFFVIRDEFGTSRRFQFRTAPAKQQPFTFIAGGDSRNFRDVRIAANQLVAKLRPLFVAFTGDMVNQDTAQEWDEWLDDWQHTTSEDGRLTPIVAHRGNHERRPKTIPAYFHTPPLSFYSFNIGGNYFRYLALNSEIPGGGKQKKWIESQFVQHADSSQYFVAGYHKPMRPHVSKKSEGTNPMNWANLFYEYGLDLALESDSHVMKRTLPLKPSAKGHEGFIAAPDDPNATVYIGEGCWGAPLRANDDNKPWTLASGSFNGFDWIHITPEQIEIRTVKIDSSSRVEPIRKDNSFKAPKGLHLWEPKSGAILTIKTD
ncbi:MAG: metallophosphoesterase family protein [Verrucomicrobiota bacterium]